MDCKPTNAHIAYLTLLIYDCGVEQSWGWWSWRWVKRDFERRKREEEKAGRGKHGGCAEQEGCGHVYIVLTLKGSKTSTRKLFAVFASLFGTFILVSFSLSFFSILFNTVLLIFIIIFTLLQWLLLRGKRPQCRMTRKLWTTSRCMKIS